MITRGRNNSVNSRNSKAMVCKPMLPALLHRREVTA